MGEMVIIPRFKAEASDPSSSLAGSSVSPASQ
jgi:hypothetical protein